MRTPVRDLAGMVARHVTRGPVARAGVAVVAGVLGATVARSIGPQVITTGSAGSAMDVAWIGVTVAIACQLVLAGVALVVPDAWRATRQG